MSLKKALETAGERHPSQLPAPDLIDAVANDDRDDRENTFDGSAPRPLILDEGKLIPLISL